MANLNRLEREAKFYFDGAKKILSAGDAVDGLAYEVLSKVAPLKSSSW